MKHLKIFNLLILGGLLAVTPMQAFAENTSKNYNCIQDINDIGARNNIDIKVTDSYITVNGFRIAVDTKSVRGQAVLSAVQKLGDPYAWGGEGAPWSGSLSTYTGETVVWSDSNYTYESRIGKPSYDCSGLIQAAYADAGIQLSHYSGSQCSEQYGGKIINSVQTMKPGDIAGDNNHVVMYLGGGYIIEAPCTGKTVRIISLQDRFGGMKFPESYTCISYFN